MSLDAQDGARLRRIEFGLTRDDPSFVARIRSWRPEPGVPPGWTTVPRWAALAFLVGLSTWMLTPVLGTIVLVLAGLGWLWQRAATRACRGPGDAGRGRGFESSRRRR